MNKQINKMFETRELSFCTSSTQGHEFVGRGNSAWNPKLFKWSSI